VRPSSPRRDAETVATQAHNGTDRCGSIRSNGPSRNLVRLDAVLNILFLCVTVQIRTRRRRLLRIQVDVCKPKRQSGAYDRDIACGTVLIEHIPERLTRPIAAIRLRLVRPPAGRRLQLRRFVLMTPGRNDLPAGTAHTITFPPTAVTKAPDRRSSLDLASPAVESSGRHRRGRLGLAT
jgi:hypothetical protein